MKIESRAARKYAAALFAVARNQELLDRAMEDLGEVARAVEANPDLLLIMKQPRIGVERKKDLVRRIFSASTHEMLSDFLQLLVDKGRFATIEAIRDEFRRLLDEHRRLLPVQVTSAVALAPDLQEKLRQRLTDATGHIVQIAYQVDPEILGGLRIRMKDQLIDGSITTQLRIIREQLKQTRVTR